MKKQSWIENTIKLIEYHNNKKENIRIKLEKSGINNHFLEPESISIKTKNFCKSILGSFTNYIPIYSKKWFKHNADKLWETRELLENEKSKSFYDSSLILKTANHQKFLFNETYNNNFLEILSEKPFNHKTLPNIYNKKC